MDTRRDAPTSAADRVAAKLAVIVHQLTGRELTADDFQRSFVEWGADSLKLIQLAGAIEREFGTRIQFRRFFTELGTLAAIAADLASGVAAAHDRQQQAATAGETGAAERPPAAAGPVRHREPRALHDIINRQLAVMEEQLAALRRSTGERRHAGRTPEPSFTAADAPPAPSSGEAERAAAPSPIARVSTVPAQAPQPYVPYRAPDRSTARLDERQSRYLTQLLERRGQRSRGSRARAAQHRGVLADPRLVTGFRPMWKDAVYPLYVASAQGARIWDVDGREYIDLCMGYGSYLFGHAPEFWVDAVRRSVGEAIGPQSERVGRVAVLVTRLTGAERAAFFNSGTEAVMAAIRAARTITGRERIAMFSGSYHGWSDQVLAQHSGPNSAAIPSAPGVPSAVAGQVSVLPYGAETSLEMFEREAGGLAAVLVEPVQSRRPDLQPVEFLRRLREITAASGSALILDEMITGFRCAPGGVQQLWGVQPDLSIYGKAAAGGLPIGIVAGRARFMDAFDGGAWEYGDESGPESIMTFCAGTYFKHPLVMAGAEACLSHLEQRGPELHRELNARSDRMLDHLRRRLVRHDLPVTVPAFGSLFRLHWTDAFPYGQLLYYALQERGVFAWEGGNFFISTAHTDADLERTAAAIEDSLIELRSAGFLPPGGSRAPQPTSSAADVGIPLTPSQRDVWLAIEVGHASSEAYNECITLELTGELDIAALQHALHQLVRRHEALRTVFDGSGPTQTFAASASVALAQIDLTAAAGEDQDTVLAGRLRALVEEPFDLGRAPLVRAALLQTAPGRRVLALVVHHLVLDNLSAGILVRELPVLYEAARRGADARLPSPASFAAFARDESDPGRVLRGEEFWLDRLRGLAGPPPALPGGNADDGHPQLVVCGRQIEAGVLDRLRAVAADAETTVVAAMLAAFQLFLHRATGCPDLVVGVPIAAQPFTGNAPLVGYCLNVLPIRSRYRPHDRFADVVRRVGRELADALEHRTCSLSGLVDRLSLAAAHRGHPLLAALFNYDVSGAPPAWPRLEVRSLSSPKAAARLPLEVNVSQEAGRLTIELVADSAIGRGAVEQWLDVLVGVVEKVAGDPGTALEAVSLANPAAAAMQMEWSRGPRVARDPETITGLVEAIAQAHPDRVAIVMADTQLTYRELQRQMHAFALHARSLGIGPDVLVPICLERTIDMVVCVLGILEAGGAYVPIDPTLVPDRIAWMLQDSRASIVFVDAATEALVSPLLPPGCRSERIVASRVDRHGVRRIERHQPRNLAYVIYTSGSTGRPKGAMNTHDGVVNQLRAIQEWLALDGDDRVLQKTTLSFDASVWELFWPLSTGATLVLASKDAQFDARALHRDIAVHRVTTTVFVPSMLREVVALLEPMSPAVRRIVCIGEPVTPTLANEVRARFPRAEFWNFYGPTEAAVAVTARCCDPADVTRVPIGKPLPNVDTYVVDERGGLLPSGMEGELYIGGVGVGRGYWNRPDLTAERFVPDPFGPSGARCYRTGDGVRWAADGQLEFIGRLDGQLKIRGYRIEAGEIESVMAQHPGVEEAAVWATGDGRDLILAAAWTGAAPQAELRAWLAARLPRYMVPARMARVTALPHLPNGKLDRNSLVRLRAEAPRDEEERREHDPVEAVVQGIWEDVLRHRVERTDSFVAAGGHSLHATQVIGRVGAALGATLPVRTLFDEPSLAAFSARVATAIRRAAPPPLAPTPRDGVLPTSIAQERFWFLDHLFETTGACNLPLAVRINGPLQVAALRAALDNVIARHEVLRTVYDVSDEGVVCQRVLPSMDVPWEVRHGDEAQALQWAQHEAVQAFDLSTGPVLRSLLVATGDDAWIWLLTLHHIAADAWSIQILWRELGAFYRAAVNGTRLELPPLSVQYADFAAAQRAYLASDALSPSLAYWRAQLAAPPPAIRWTPTSGASAPAVARDVVAHVEVDEASAVLLSALMTSVAATQSMVVVAAMQVVVWQRTNQAEFVVGVPIHGRSRRELEPLIGCFVNLLPIRAGVNGQLTFAELLADVRSKMLEAYTHAELPFELAIVDRNRVARPLVGLVVSTRNVPTLASPIAELTCVPFEAARPASSHELLCEVGLRGGRWHLDLTGSGELFTAAEIARLADQLSGVLADAAAEPARPIGSLSQLAGQQAR